MDSEAEDVNAKTQRRKGRRKEQEVDMPFDDEDPPYLEPDAELNALAHAVIGAALAVHKQLGAGLDESLYRNAMCIELRKRGIKFICEMPVDVLYDGQVIGQRRIDLFVEARLVVELKAIDRLAPVHKAQVRTYLKITKTN
jgi:GxxExxY protein